VPKRREVVPSVVDALWYRLQHCRCKLCKLPRHVVALSHASCYSCLGFESAARLFDLRCLTQVNTCMDSRWHNLMHLD